MPEEEKAAKPDEMSEPDQTSDEKPQTPEKNGKGSLITLWTSFAILLCLALLAGHILADKYTPYTSNGRIEAYVVPIVPQVSGELTEVNVASNEIVKADHVLAVIDPRKYELAVRRAEADLQLATQTSDADVSAVSAAQARVAEAEANLQNTIVKGERIIRLSEQGAASVSRADDARSRIEANRAKLDSARSELEKAKSNLGETGEQNAKIRSALVALESAQLDLYHTEIRAPADGIITNLIVDVGNYASSGVPVMTFISTRSVWIQADMRENSLVNVKPGDPAEMVLDAAPGKIFSGAVMSIGYGVFDNVNNTPGALAVVQPSQGWLRQPQHIPVLIRFNGDNPNGAKRVGGQVNVIVYTGSHPILNTLGKWWIRITSLLSHLY